MLNSLFGPSLGGCLPLLLFGMADTAQLRKEHVQTLRGLARTCGVQAVRDDARKDKVEELGKKLLECAALGVQERQLQNRTAP